MARPTSRWQIDQRTLAAFVSIVVLGGLNAIAVKASNAELAPFWGAALRFGGAAGLLALIALWRRPALPRDRGLVGSAIYGVLSFTVFYALLYNALLSVAAGLAMVLLALAPLLTLLLAAAIDLERLGAGIAVAGIAIVFGERLGSGAPLIPALAVVGGAATVAASSVVIKGFPKVDPVANNLVAMTVGTLGLIGLSVVAGEPWRLPTRADTWTALAYLVALGSVAMFVLYVEVVGRWTASAAAYTVVLMPLVTVPAAAIIAGEAITLALVTGGLVVLGGVYIGAISAGGRPAPPTAARPAAVAAAGATTPGCP